MSVRGNPSSGKKPIFDRISIFEQKQQAQANPPPPRGQNLVNNILKKPKTFKKLTSTC